MVVTPFFFLSGATAVDQLPQGFAGSTSYPPFYAFRGFSPSGTVAATPDQRGKRGRRYRLIEDPDLLQEVLAKEEQKVEKEKKKLTVLVKTAASPTVEGVLYQQIQKKVEILEAKIDDRLQRIAEISLAIQVALAEQEEDDEEVLLLS